MVAPWTNVSASFTVIFWAKPEVAQYGTTGYVFFPSPTPYGSATASSSIAMGWNGIELGETTSSTPTTVFTLTQTANNFTISGWTLVAVVYDDNQPSLYINGVLVGTGPKSTYTVHPGVDTPDSTAKMITRFNGDIAGLEVVGRSLSTSDILRTYVNGLPPPGRPKALSLRPQGQVLIRESGTHSFESSNGQNTTVEVPVLRQTVINSTWTLTLPAIRLPPGRNGTDLDLRLPKLISLKDHPNFDVAHFSGTMTYRNTFHLPASSYTTSQQARRWLLTLGRLENIANVTVNNCNLGISWLPPYELDVTECVHTYGSNTLVVEVTNIWPNRLIDDETLPPEASYNSTTEDFSVNAWPDWFVAGLNGTAYDGDGAESTWGEVGFQKKPGERVTFTAWKHYNATYPLFESGLMGPVTISEAALVTIGA